MATDKKAMAFDVDIGTGHQRGNPQDEKIRHHLEQEAKEHSGRLHDPQQSLEEAEKRREKMLEDRKEKAHQEVQHAKEVAAKVKQQKSYVDQRAGKWDSTTNI